MLSLGLSPEASQGESVRNDLGDSRPTQPLRRRNTQCVSAANPSFSPAMATSLATMAGLVWSPTGQCPQDMTKSGAPVYSGTAIGYSQWELIVTARWTSY